MVVENDPVPSTRPSSSSAAATCTSLCVSTPPNTRTATSGGYVIVVIAIPFVPVGGWHAQPVPDRPMTRLLARASFRSRSTVWLCRWRSAHRVDRSDTRTSTTGSRALAESDPASGAPPPFSLAFEDARRRDYMPHLSDSRSWPSVPERSRDRRSRAGGLGMVLIAGAARVRSQEPTSGAGNDRPPSIEIAHAAYTCRSFSRAAHCVLAPPNV